MGEDAASLRVQLGRAHGVVLNSNGSYSIDAGGEGSGSKFSERSWHRVELSGAKDWTCVTIDGVVLGNVTAAEDQAPWEPNSAAPNGGWIQDPWVAWSMGPVNQGGAPSISLSRYIFAEIDNFELSSLHVEYGMK